MGLFRFLFGGLVCSAVILPMIAHASDLSPRAEVSVKAGSERSALTTEFWAPLAQRSDRVVYTDLRLMGDNDDNREGNLGIGYRQVYAPTNSVLGIHGWIDRRRTEHNSTFHQATFGVESLGDKIDLRANGYIPLNGSHAVTTPNLGSATPYLAGNGLFYDTTGSVSETPQYGVDAEAGYRLPIFEKQIDTIRIFGGGYHFFRSDTDNVTGFRIRTEAAINKLLSVGARFQHDGPRGSQGFLEATLRFPFSAKKLYQTDKLRSRLDESPERDIDIVTASKVDTGLRKEIVNTTTGDAQRIIYVDNTNNQTGDGTKEHPFSNLQSAQTALRANDILYIFHGDGTTHNMDQGIVIDKPGVRLIGSGSALAIDGYTFLNPTTAPVITNTQAVTTDALSKIVTGSGIYVLAGDTNISGVTVSGAQGTGIFVRLEGADSNYSFVTLDNNTVIGNLQQGITINVFNGASVSNVLVSNNNTSNNILWGILATSGQVGTGHIGTIDIENNSSNNNSAYGFVVTSDNAGSSIDHLIINHNAANNNTVNVGILAAARSGGTLGTVNVENNTLNNNNGGMNVAAYNGTGSVIGDTIISNNTIIGSGGLSGITAGVQNNASGSNLTIANNTVANVNNSGISVFGLSNSYYNNVNITDNISTGNLQQGIYANYSGGGITNLTVQNNNTSNNKQQGILVSQSTAFQANTVVLANNTSNSNLLNGIDLKVQNTFASVNSAVISNNTTTGNAKYGLSVAVTTNAVLADLNIDTLTASNNGSNVLTNAAVFLQVNSGTIGNASLSNITASNNTGATGILISNLTNGIIGNVSLSNIAANNNAIGLTVGVTNAFVSNLTLLNVTLNNNTTRGTLIQAGGSGSINNLTGTSVTANNNSTNGIYILDQGTGAISNINLSGITANNNANGLAIQGDSTGTINGGTISNVTATGNTAMGVRIDASTDGIVKDLVVTNVTSMNNATGFYISGSTAAAVINNISLSNNNFINNTANGLYLNKVSTTYKVDAGGGSSGSSGGNRLFGNTTTDLRIDGGYGLKAQSNWWGVATAPTRVTLNGGSTVDSTGFLTVDPRP